LAILGRVFHAGRLQFDCYSPFPFQFHIVKELILHIPDSHCARFLQETVGQGRFAMIDVGDDTEIANVLHEAVKRTANITLESLGFAV
jgi:hypothetical protein